MKQEKPLSPKEFLSQMSQRDGAPPPKRGPSLGTILLILAALTVIVAPVFFFPRVCFPILMVDLFLIGGLVIYYFSTRA
jgi:hypothetical protein